MTNEKIEQVFEIGKKYTTFKINGLAMTCKSEIEITEYHEGNPVFKHRGKRKKFILKLRTRHYAAAPEKEYDGAVFEGWDQPITCDTDGSSGMRCMRGNALYNFVAEPGAIRDWIDAGQLNPNFDRSLVCSVGVATGQDEVLCYPDLYRGGHAVIDRILAKEKQKA